MRLWLRTLLGLVVVVGVAGPGWAATDLATMQPAEIEALQKRLTDDGCYAGPIDSRASAATSDAVIACPDQQPVLRIETGMHIAQIKTLGIDSACTVMVTGSDDKTIRLWSVPDGRLLRVIRLPIGSGANGRIYAVALSPDGRTLVAGGLDAGWEKGKSIGLYSVDLHSGMVRRIGAFEKVIEHIALSDDHTRIGVALGGSLGVRVLDAATGRELMSDRDYGDSSYGMVFGPDGTLFTTSLDGFLRRYGPDLKLSAKVKAPDGTKAFGIALNPTGSRLAIGYLDSSTVSLVNPRSLQLIARAKTDNDSSNFLSNVTWSADGNQMAAGGGARGSVRGPLTFRIYRFGQSGNQIGMEVPTAANTITDLKPCGPNIAYAAADPSFGWIDGNGRAWTLQDPVTMDMRGIVGDSFTLSADASIVRFDLDVEGTKSVLFNLAAGTLADLPDMLTDMSPAAVDGLGVADWQYDEHPKLAGQPLLLNPYETSKSLAIRRDQTGFALGTGLFVRAFDAVGKERWRNPATGGVWHLNLSADGSIVVAAYGDGTIRWLRWSDGQELLAMFVHVPSRRWVAWTPTGYYMASPGAEDMIGWHVNRGWNQEADFFPASRFRDRFNRPDVVQTVLQTLDEAEALRNANAKAKRRDDQTPILQHLPPVITILSPSDGSSVGPGLVEVRYRTRTPSGGKVDRIDTFVDGAKIQVRGLGAPATDEGSGTLTLAMPAHNAEISLVAYAGDQASDVARVQLRTSVAEGAAGGTAKPTLYALLVGVSHYEDADLNLGYAAKDASDLADALKTQSGRLYADVQVKVLTDSAATSVALKDGLAWLAAHATDRDLELLFLAGHGITDAKGKFWFLTYDADPARISSTAVSRDDITGVLYDLPGKKLMFLDACHSGAALEQAGARGLERSGADLNKALSDFSQAEGGVVAYAASTGRESSYEQEEWGHGAFTKALLEGIGGNADLLHNKTVTTATLDAFLENRVKELTNGRQHPVMTRPKTVPDFPIATVN